MLLDRVSLKNEAKGILRGACVSPYLFTLLFMGISLVLTAVSDFVSFDEDMVHNIYYSTGVDLSFLVLHRAFPAALVTFVSILVSLLSVLLNAGYYRYHLAVRGGEDVPYLVCGKGVKAGMDLGTKLCFGTISGAVRRLLLRREADPAGAGAVHLHLPVDAAVHHPGLHRGLPLPLRCV